MCIRDRSLSPTSFVAPTRLRLFRWKPTPCGSSSLVVFHLTHAVDCVLIVDDIWSGLVGATKEVGLRLTSVSLVEEANNDSALSHFLFYSSVSVRAPACRVRSGALPHTRKVLGNDASYILPY